MTHVFKKSSVCVARHYAPMPGRARAPVGSGLCAVRLAVCGECGERDVGVCWCFDFDVERGVCVAVSVIGDRCVCVCARARTLELLVRFGWIFYIL